MGHYLSNQIQTAVPAAFLGDEAYLEDPAAAFKRAFASAQEAVKNAPGSRESGTTASMVLLRKEQIDLAWVGDSHVLVAERTKKGDYSGKLLTYPHRPEDKKERARIEASGGVVELYKDGASSRVFDQTRQGPGLVVSR